MLDIDHLRHAILNDQHRARRHLGAHAARILLFRRLTKRARRHAAGYIHEWKYNRIANCHRLSHDCLCCDELIHTLK